MAKRTHPTSEKTGADLVKDGKISKGTKRVTRSVTKRIKRRLEEDLDQRTGRLQQCQRRQRIWTQMMTDCEIPEQSKTIFIAETLERLFYWSSAPPSYVRRKLDLAKQNFHQYNVHVV